MKRQILFSSSALSFILTLVFLVFGLFSPRVSLESTRWQLVAWSASSASPEGYNISLNIDKKTFSGHSSVNTYGGGYKIFGKDGIRFSTAYQTEMAGTPEAMHVESLYLSLLGQVGKFKADENSLVLSDAKGNQLLIFEKV
ncbi:MAG TPA: META domain-containing protein [Clostridiales bacterium]|nr:META domain-containing protein [Clostridiales bacterium]